jgi:hypothetical protein
MVYLLIYLLEVYLTMLSATQATSQKSIQGSILAVEGETEEKNEESWDSQCRG